jgi:hypothetical protein
MTQLLDKALAEINRLTPTEQDWIAALILDELADEHQLAPVEAEAAPTPPDPAAWEPPLL